MPILTAAEVAGICAGRLLGDGNASATTIGADSRTGSAGEAFVAVRGGHAFVSGALAAGAPFVVVERDDAVPAGATGVVVDDTVRALLELAAWARDRIDVQVIAITGSFGKTLTKDFTAAALAPRYRVHAARGSYNTDVGLPLVVLSCPDEAEALVVELGARRPGEIAELASVCRPHVGLITGIGTTHIEIFGSRDAIARTKAELLEALPPDGLALVPAGDDYLGYLSSRTAARLETVGPGGATRYRADGIAAEGSTWGRLYLHGRETPVTLPIPGRALLRNAAMAVRAAAELGVDPADAAAAVGKARTAGARMQVDHVGGWTVVNDAYNANPVSTASALRTVAELRAGAERWAVLGEMAELGTASVQAHVRVGRLARELGFAGIVVVGSGAGPIASGAGGIALRAGSIPEAADLVCDLVPAGAVVLVKGSLVTGLRTFSDELRGRVARSREGV